MLRPIIAAALAVAAGAAATAQEVQQEAPAPFAVPRSEVRTLTSETLGRTYDLFVKLPPGYRAERNAGRTYPVVWLTDDAYVFQTAAGITHMPMNFGGFEHAILVGLSYARAEDGQVSRTRDYTPTPLPNAQLAHGGASAYLDFLEREAIPLVEKTYRADPTRRTLVGQSYGGLFGIYALLTRPGLFSDYILTSPSLWFDDYVVFRLEEDFAKKSRALPARVYFATGSLEAPGESGWKRDMAGDTTRLAAQLRARGYAGLEVRDEIIDGATHQTTFPVGFTRGMMWLHRGPTPYAG